MTRAKAAEVAERMHIDEDAVLDMSNIEEKIEPATPEPTERAVLGNIAPNSADSNKSDLVARKTRSKKKGKAATEAKTDPKIEDQEENGAGGQSEKDALEATTNETMERLAKLRIASLGNQQPSATPQSENDSNAAATGEVAEAAASESNDAEDDSAVQSVTPTRRESTSELPSISIVTQSGSHEDEDSVHYNQDAPEPPSSPIATAMPKVIKSLRRDSPTKRSTSNKENVEPVEPEAVEPAEEEQDVATVPLAPATVQDPSISESTSVDATATAAEQPVTPSSPTRRSEGKAGDSIEALDKMDEAVEKVNIGIANASSPGQKLSSKPSNDKEKPKKTKPAPVVRLTKAAAARLSMAQTGNKDNSSSTAAARSRPSTVPGRTNGVRQSVAPAAANKPLPKPKTETVIPHSKPRPVSLSFPTPPPAAKSTKAPTKSSFQLPGEAVAAKLKAAREERLKREAAAATSKANDKAASDEKKPAFKARPVPSMLKKTPSVRHTAASRARESMMTGDAAPKPAVSSSSATGLKRSNTVGSTRPRPSMAPTSSTKPSQPAQLTVQKRARPSSVHVTSKEIAAAAPRQPSSSSSRASIAPAARSTSSTSKGKEVYARNAAARNAAENEKKEKEDAARKARAAAAERGRAASREWAEKQKVKKMIAKMEGEVAKA